MKDQLIALIHQANPWLKNPEMKVTKGAYIPRLSRLFVFLTEILS